MLLVTEIFYVLTMLFLKISLAIFFLRIMVAPWQRRVVYITAGIATAFSLAYFFFAIFQCGVPKGPYVFFIRKLSGQCVTPTQILGFSYAHGAITSLTDVIFGFLPIPMLHHTTMNRREKTTVGFILILGAMYGAYITST
jgi:hypothetical protein